VFIYLERDSDKYPSGIVAKRVKNSLRYWGSMCWTRTEHIPVVARLLLCIKCKKFNVPGKRWWLGDKLLHESSMENTVVSPLPIENEITRYCWVKILSINEKVNFIISYLYLSGFSAPRMTMSLTAWCGNKFIVTSRRHYSTNTRIEIAFLSNSNEVQRSLTVKLWPGNLWGMMIPRVYFRSFWPAACISY